MELLSISSHFPNVFTVSHTQYHYRHLILALYSQCPVNLSLFKEEDKDLFIGPQEFVVGYSKAPEQPQSSARPICHSHAMTRTGHEPATIRIAA